MSLDGKYAKWVLLGFSAIAFVLLLALEVVTETGTMSLADLAVDATHILLTIAASVGAVLLLHSGEQNGADGEKLKNLRACGSGVIDIAADSSGRRPASGSIVCRA